MKTNRKESSVTSAASSQKGNVSFIGSGKVSVSVETIVSSAAVRRQVASVRKIAEAAAKSN